MLPEFEQKLDQIRPRHLSERRRHALWLGIQHRLEEGIPQKSTMNNISRRIVALITALGLVFGGGIAVAYAADSAKPGDALFPVDQAVEGILLTFSFGSTKEKLEVSISEERFNEVLAILQEEDIVSTISDNPEVALASLLSEEAATSTQEMDTLTTDDEEEVATTTAATTTTQETATTTTATTTTNKKSSIKSNERVSKALELAINRIEGCKSRVESGSASTSTIAALNSMLSELDKVASAQGYTITKVDAKATTSNNTVNLAFNAKDSNGSKVSVKLVAKDTNTVANSNSNNNRGNQDNGNDDNHGNDNGNDRDNNNGNSNGNNSSSWWNKGRNNDDRNEDKDHKTTICHNDQTITVDDNALKAHLAHGDTKGECKTPEQPPQDTTAPTFSNVSVSRTQTNATVKWETNEKTSAQFFYGTTTPVTKDNAKILSTSALATKHSANLTQLTASTTYYYLIVAKDKAGNVATSTEYNFTTKQVADTQAPTLSDITATTTLSTATITWNTNESATGKMLYGVSSPTTEATESGTHTSHSIALSGLATSTTYKYIVVSTDAAGNTSTSTEKTFLTLTPEPEPEPADTTAPVISAVDTANIATTTADVTWTTNEVAKSTVYYGLVTPLDTTASTTDMMTNASLVTAHTLSLTGLTASTTYYYLVTSADEAGNTATSTEHSFITLGS